MRVLRPLQAMLLLTIASVAAHADGSVAGVVTVPLSWTSEAQTSVDAGLQELARLNPSAYTDLTTRLQGGDGHYRAIGGH